MYRQLLIFFIIVNDAMMNMFLVWLQHTDCAKLIESRIKKCRRFYYLKYMEAEDS